MTSERRAQQWLPIGEVARRAGVTVRTLHHYDRLGLLVPSGRSGGEHRRYGPADLRRLLDIAQLRSLGLSLAEVRAALDDPDFNAAATLDRQIAHLEERIALHQRLLVRLRGLRAGGEAAWPDVLDTIALTGRLGHPDATVRVRAALGARPLPLPELLNRLAAETDPAVRATLVWAVVRHGAAAVQPLIGLLAEVPGPDVRLHVAHALAKLGDTSATLPLMALLDDPAPSVRSAAATALGRLLDERALPGLVNLLGAGDDTDAALTEALACFGERAAALLAQDLPATPRARLHAVEVLDRVAGADAGQVLVRLARDADPEVRLAAVFALAERDGAEVEEAIRCASASDDPRLAALGARITAERSRRQPAAGR